MCIMCLEIFKGRMSITEGRKALTELLATTEDKDLLDHYRELEEADDEKMRELVNNFKEKA